MSLRYPATTPSCMTSPRSKVDAAIANIDKNLARQVASGKISEEDRQNTLARISYAETLASSATPTS